MWGVEDFFFFFYTMRVVTQLVLVLWCVVGPVQSCRSASRPCLAAGGVWCVVRVEQHLGGRGCTRACVDGTPANSLCVRIPSPSGVCRGGAACNRPTRRGGWRIGCWVFILGRRQITQGGGRRCSCVGGMVVQGRVNTHGLTPVGLSYGHSSTHSGSWSLFIVLKIFFVLL